MKKNQSNIRVGIDQFSYRPPRHSEDTAPCVSIVFSNSLYREFTEQNLLKLLYKSKKLHDVATRGKKWDFSSPVPYGVINDIGLDRIDNYHGSDAGGIHFAFVVLDDKWKEKTILRTEDLTVQEFFLLCKDAKEAVVQF